MNSLLAKSTLLILAFIVTLKGTAQDLQLQQDPDQLRIVAAGGSLTEIIFALGAEHLLVGIDSSSQYPQKTAQIANVGYYRQLSTEGVLSVAPNLVIGLDTMGPANVVKQLESLGIRKEIVPVERSVNGLMSKISQLGRLLDRQQQAQSLVVQIQTKLDALPKVNRTSTRVVFLMSAGQRGLMAAGSDTVPDLIFELSNLVNPYSHIKGFKPVSEESLLSLNPDLLVIPTHQQGGRSAEEICALPSLKLWSQSRGCQAVFVDSLSFLGVTPRLPDAAAYLVNTVNRLD